MNTKVVLFVLLAGIATMGSTCINDGFVVSVNLESIGKSFPINVTQTTSSFQESVTIDPGTLLDESYADKIKTARLVDIKVSVGGYSGMVDGDASLDGNHLFHFRGLGSDLATPRSILTDKSYYTNTNFAPLLTLLTTQPLPSGTTLQTSGTLNPAAQAPGTVTISIDIYTQVDAVVN